MIKVRSLIVTAAALSPLLVPISARADVTKWTVDPAHSGACDTTAHVCGTIGSAIAAAANGDEVDITPGTYKETVDVSKDNLTIKGLSSGSSGVALQPGAPGAPLTVSGAGDRIESVLVFDSASHGGAIQVTGNSVTVQDTIVLATGEPGLVINNSGNNVLARSTLIANGANTVELHAANGAASNLSIDSTVASGTGGSAAVLAQSEATLSLIGGGTAQVTARHLTTDGQTYGLLANAPVLLSGAASISADNSIVHGKTGATNATHSALSTATATVTNSDTDSADDATFVDATKFDFHLKKGAAAINKGTDTPAADAMDIDGQSRLVGAQTDQGADEYDDIANTAPTVTATPTTAATGQAVAFQAADAPDAATTNGVDHYVFAYGDNANGTSATGAASHSFAAAGTYNVTVVAVGKSGAVSPPATVPVTVSGAAGGSGGGGTGVDGGNGGNSSGACTGGLTQANGAPTVEILSPKNSAVLKLTKTVTKKIKRKHHKTRKVKVKVANPPTVKGVACDSDGVGSVKIAVLYLGKSKKLPTAGSCQAFNGSTKFSSVSCASATFFSTKLSDFNWSFKFSSKAKLKSGYYAVFVKGTDLKGNADSSLSTTAKTAAVFREK